MKQVRRVCIWATVLLMLSASQTLAANHYIRAGASGSNNGSNWTNAWTALPSTMQRGDTYYVADGQYASVALDDALSGTQTITVKKATVADHGTGTGWNDSYGDGQAVFTSGFSVVTGYYILDGQVRGDDWKSGYGFRIDASAGKGINIASSSTTASHVTVRYVEIEGRGNDGAGSPSNDLVYILPAISNFTIQYSYLHDTGRTAFLFRQADDGLIEYCYVARNESTAAQHSEAISAYNGTDRWTVRYNIWEDIEGTGIIIFSGDGWQLYGNVCFETGRPGYGGISNGSFATWTGYTVTNARLHNNTFISLTGLNSGLRFDAQYASGNLAYNNLWYKCVDVGMGGTSGDYNLFIATAFSWDTQAQPHDVVQPNGADPFADWPNGDFHLTAATAAGLSLPVPFNRDLAGSIRGGDGTWDRGAMEFVAGVIVPGGWRLVAPHGAAEIVSSISENHVEPRNYGLRKLRVEFGSPLDPATVSNAVVSIVGDTSGNQVGLIQGVTLHDPSTLEIVLSSALPDRERFTVTISTALHIQGGSPVSGDLDIRLATLAGDADASGQVTAADTAAVREKAGQAVTAETARYDLDGSAAITAADMQATRSRIGSQLP